MYVAIDVDHEKRSSPDLEQCLLFKAVESTKLVNLSLNSAENRKKILMHGNIFSSISHRLVVVNIPSNFRAPFFYKVAKSSRQPVNASNSVEDFITNSKHWCLHSHQPCSHP